MFDPVQSVINASPEVEIAVEAAGAEHLLVDVPDVATSNLLQHLPRAVAFISGALASRGRVLVHCYEGVSRSVTVSLACHSSNLPAHIHSQVSSLQRCVDCSSEHLSGHVQVRDCIVAPLRQQPGAAAQPHTAPERASTCTAGGAGLPHVVRAAGPGGSGGLSACGLPQHSPQCRLQGPAGAVAGHGLQSGPPA